MVRGQVTLGSELHTSLGNRLSGVAWAPTGRAGWRSAVGSAGYIAKLSADTLGSAVRGEPQAAGRRITCADASIAMNGATRSAGPGARRGDLGVRQPLLSWSKVESPAGRLRLDAAPLDRLRFGLADRERSGRGVVGPGSDPPSGCRDKCEARRRELRLRAGAMRVHRLREPWTCHSTSFTAPVRPRGGRLLRPITPVTGSAMSSYCERRARYCEGGAPRSTVRRGRGRCKRSRPRGGCERRRLEGRWLRVSPSPSSMPPRRRWFERRPREGGTFRFSPAATGSAAPPRGAPAPSARAGSAPARRS